MLGRRSLRTLAAALPDEGEVSLHLPRSREGAVGSSRKAGHRHAWLAFEHGPHVRSVRRADDDTPPIGMVVLCELLGGENVDFPVAQEIGGRTHDGAFQAWVLAMAAELERRTAR